MINTPCNMNTDRSLKLNGFFGMAALAVLIVASCATASAQPSGGPYGPVRQSWPVPEKAGRIFYVSPDGDINAPGENISAPTTIEAAITGAVTGDVIIM